MMNIRRAYYAFKWRSLVKAIANYEIPYTKYSFLAALSSGLRDDENMATNLEQAQKVQFEANESKLNYT